MNLQTPQSRRLPIISSRSKPSGKSQSSAAGNARPVLSPQHRFTGTPSDRHEGRRTLAAHDDRDLLDGYDNESSEQEDNNGTSGADGFRPSKTTSSRSRHIPNASEMLDRRSTAKGKRRQEVVNSEELDWHRRSSAGSEVEQDDEDYDLDVQADFYQHEEGMDLDEDNYAEEDVNYDGQGERDEGQEEARNEKFDHRKAQPRRFAQAHARFEPDEDVTAQSTSPYGVRAASDARGSQIHSHRNASHSRPYVPHDQQLDNMFSLLGSMASDIRILSRQVSELGGRAERVSSTPSSSILAASLPRTQPRIRAESAAQYTKQTGKKVSVDVLWTEREAKSAFIEQEGKLEQKCAVPFEFIVRDTSGAKVGAARMSVIREVLREATAVLLKLKDRRTPDAAGKLGTRSRSYYTRYHRFEFNNMIAGIEDDIPELSFCLNHYKTYNGVDRRLKSMAILDSRSVEVVLEPDSEIDAAPTRASKPSSSVPKTKVPSIKRKSVPSKPKTTTSPTKEPDPRSKAAKKKKYSNDVDANGSDVESLPNQSTGNLLRPKARPLTGIRKEVNPDGPGSGQLQAGSPIQANSLSAPLRPTLFIPRRDTDTVQGRPEIARPSTSYSGQMFASQNPYTAATNSASQPTFGAYPYSQPDPSSSQHYYPSGQPSSYGPYQSFLLPPAANPLPRV
ncbi:hypothetical protein A4X13_0g2515 [Tilletia indica]|uniref:Uncharacterized protein n=1 Tax=Tilletia indica TaxID=43049 RepID=A0A177THQ5_9BASI|nr:hypothetical protein A4X13_0g2515 [Tilletia indica]